MYVSFAIACQSGRGLSRGKYVIIQFISSSDFIATEILTSLKNMVNFIHSDSKCSQSGKLSAKQGENFSPRMYSFF